MNQMHNEWRLFIGGPIHGERCHCDSLAYKVPGVYRVQVRPVEDTTADPEPIQVFTYRLTQVGHGRFVMLCENISGADIPAMLVDLLDTMIDMPSVVASKPPCDASTCSYHKTGLCWNPAGICPERTVSLGDSRENLGRTDLGGTPVPPGKEIGAKEIEKLKGG